MSNFFEQDGSKLDPNTKRLQSKLYVAYLNEAMMGCSIKDDHVPSVFSSTGGAYYINGIPAILSLDAESILYDGDGAEYY